MNSDQTKALNLLKTARGQVNKVIEMLEEERYCMDVSTQILAVQGLLKKANLLILEQHMNHCVKEAFEVGNGEEKVSEIMRLLDTYTKN
jgi:DNA-binding FrmR family transcriptional regulator